MNDNIIINQLKDEIQNLKDNLKILLLTIGKHHPTMIMPKDEDLYLAFHDCRKFLDEYKNNYKIEY